MNAATLGALLKEGAAILSEAGVDAPEHDAKTLLAHVLDVNLNDVLLHADREAQPIDARLYWHLIALRARRMPLQYVTRVTYFCGLRLKIEDRALIPRQETEQLVEAVVERLQKLLPGPADYVVDVGCGSGAIGLCVASQVPRTQVVMTDVSQDALDLTAENATCLGLTDRVVLLQGSYLEPIWGGGLEHGVVAVICNPPYVRPDEMTLLDPEVHAEPNVAIESPAADGMEAYRVVAKEASQLPRLRLLAFEVGFEQAPDVVAMVQHLGQVEVLLDYADIERMVIVHVGR